MTDKTKNEVEWEKIFDKYDIITEIHAKGYYEIESKTINEFRESRLMTKYDHRDNLPTIFKKNNLSILPISRYKYAIGKFDTYCRVKYDTAISPTSVRFPQNIESIDHTNLYSESSALLCASLTGIIDDVMEEDSTLTVLGRMSTDTFDFHIRNTQTGSLYKINVKNSQCEIDSAFESDSKFLIVEAKNTLVDDFIIRQLYYPYRLWENKIHKDVITALMTYSNNIFDFFLFSFDETENYNSIRLLGQKRYIIGAEDISLDDILNILEKTPTVREPQVPFPQADKFERVVDLLGLLYINEMTKDDITENYQFRKRQTDYYTNAAIYLGLVIKIRDRNRGVVYQLSKKGRQIMQMPYRKKYLSLAKCILEHEVFKKAVYMYLQLGKPPEHKIICEIMDSSYIYNVGRDNTTIPRRAQSVLNWANWILGLVNN